MSTNSLADLAMLLCMIPAVAIVWAVFLIPPYKEPTDTPTDKD